MSKHNQYVQQQNDLPLPPPPQQRSIAFLPMLCSSSTKEIKLSHRRCASSSSASSSSISEDPSSPKVGCMGQVKRNNRVVGFHNIIDFSSNNITSSSSATTSSHHAIKYHNYHQHEQKNYSSNSIVKYHKLKRFFSSKSLASSSPTSVIPSARPTAKGGSHKGRNCPRNNSSSFGNSRGKVNAVCRGKVDENKNTICANNKTNVEKECLVNLVDLDPPLPVVKKPVLQMQSNDGENGSTLWKRRSGGVPLKGLQVQVVHQSTKLVTASTV